MDVPSHDWIARFAQELRLLWPALRGADAVDIAAEVWRQADEGVEPEQAAREEMRTYRRLS